MTNTYGIFFRPSDKQCPCLGEVVGVRYILIPHMESYYLVVSIPVLSQMLCHKRSHPPFSHLCCTFVFGTSAPSCPRRVWLAQSHNQSQAQAEHRALVFFEHATLDHFRRAIVPVVFTALHVSVDTGGAYPRHAERRIRPLVLQRLLVRHLFVTLINSPFQCRLPSDPHLKNRG